MVEFTCEITGLEELKDILNSQMRTQLRKALREAAEQMAQVWIDAIVAKVPRDTGFLAEHITSLIRYRDGGSSLDLKVGPVKEAFYILFTEFGTAFMAAQPAMRPAYEEHKDEVVEIFAAALQTAIEKLRK